MNSSSLGFKVVGLIALAALALGAYAELRSLSGSLILPAGQSYPVKFVCGVMPNASSTIAFAGPVNPGRYTTSINIRNPYASSTTITKQAMLAPREPSTGSPVATVHVNLPGSSATSADCTDIYALLKMAATSTIYVEGYVNITSDNANINVDAVYTAQSLLAKGTFSELSSLQVVHIVPEQAP